MSTGPGLCKVCTDREVNVESFWMPDVSFPASQLKVSASMMQTKWISFCWCIAQKHKHSQSRWRDFFLMNVVLAYLSKTCVGLHFSSLPAPELPGPSAFSKWHRDWHGLQRGDDCVIWMSTWIFPDWRSFAHVFARNQQELESPTPALWR